MVKRLGTPHVKALWGAAGDGGGNRCRGTSGRAAIGALTRRLKERHCPSRAWNWLLSGVSKVGRVLNVAATTLT